MFSLIISSLIFFALGAIVGNWLATKGITADNALVKHQRLVGGIFLVVAVFLVLLVLLTNANINLRFLIPGIIRLYLGEYTYSTILVLSFFVLGFVLFLELPGRNSPRRMRQLFVAIVGITIPIAILFNVCWPVTGFLKPSLVERGIVLQTTDITCVPASIATLGRLVGKHPNLTEKDVVLLTNTGRFGTSTLAAIRAMDKLGLNPQFQEHLTIDDLLKANHLALLNVLENVNGKKIAHAVVLLSINPQSKVVTLANPIWGRQKKTPQEMKDYWLGEAIFVQSSSLSKE
jgi:predicted double-glycine peptidase